MSFDYKKNSRPLLFKEKDFNFPYSLGGTCFLFTYEDKPYIVTAKHCLRERDIAALTILINPWSGATDVYPFSFTSPFHILPDNEQTDPNEDYLDVIYYPVDNREITEETKDFFLPFQKVFDSDFSLEQRKICVAGYPDPVHGIDYEKGVYESSCAIISAIKITKEDGFMYEIQLPDTPLKSYNGFSGSPVYNVDTAGKIKIIGMVLRGCADSKKLHFLDIRIIRAAVHGIHHAIYNQICTGKSRQ